MKSMLLRLQAVMFAAARDGIITIMLCIALIPQSAFAVTKEKIVLIPGLNPSCLKLKEEPQCTDSGYLMSDLGGILMSEMVDNHRFADINEFIWSRNPLSHGEGGNLKLKFKSWFQNNICLIDDSDCNVTFIAHSWGSIILVDFLASLSNEKIKIRTIITYGSPVTGAQMENNSYSFLNGGIDNFEKFKSSSNSKWFNIVHKDDPIAWDYKYKVSDIEPSGITSTKGSYNGEFFPVNNSEIGGYYIKPWNVSIIGKFSEHATGRYNPNLIASNVVNGIPLCNFSDINDTSNVDKKDAIRSLCESNIINGKNVQDSSIRPRDIKPLDKINRAEFSKIISRYRNDGQDYECKIPPGFMDVSNTAEWYYVFICDLKNNSIISGYGSKSLDGGCPKDGGNKYFCPERNISYAEVAKIVLKSVLEFSVKDAATPDAWYKDYMKCAETDGINLFSKYSSVNPSADASREDVFYALNRAINLKYLFDLPLSIVPSNCKAK